MYEENHKSSVNKTMLTTRDKTLKDHSVLAKIILLKKESLYVATAPLTSIISTSILFQRAFQLCFQ